MIMVLFGVIVVIVFIWYKIFGWLSMLGYILLSIEKERFGLKYMCSFCDLLLRDVM